MMGMTLLGVVLALTLGAVAKDPPRGSPPPGGALSLNPVLARLIVREMAATRMGVSIPRSFMLHGYTLSESRNIDMSSSGLRFDYEQRYTDGSSRPKTATLDFRRKYCAVRSSQSMRSEVKKSHFYFTCSDGDYWNGFVFAWRTEAEAQRFADAVNRLIYENIAGPRAPVSLLQFRTRAEQWRQDRARYPQPSNWDRHRLLAEDAIREKDLIGAIQHYEQGLEAYEFWPEGWFNAALLYAELGEYGAAADRMNHYLELTPDAPDAPAARERVVVWEAKAKR